MTTQTEASKCVNCGATVEPIQVNTDRVHYHCQVCGCRDSAVITEQVFLSIIGPAVVSINPTPVSTAKESTPSSYSSRSKDF